MNDDNANRNSKLCCKPMHNKVDFWEDASSMEKLPPGYKTKNKMRQTSEKEQYSTSPSHFGADAYLIIVLKRWHEMQGVRNQKVGSTKNQDQQNYNDALAHNDSKQRITRRKW